MIMKIKIIKPRNHIARLACTRKAGAHGKSKKAIRRMNKIQFQRELGV